MPLIRRATEYLARKTTRRGFFSRGGDVAFGALIGAAAGTAVNARSAVAGPGGCAFPGPACPCDGCLSNGMCAKPCIIMTVYYAGGCWVTPTGTCCDCDCNGLLGPIQVCGCGSVHHTNPANCP
ncbi:MAG: hypothetical protein WEB04_03735 [Dehalococcoidia bacterium]